MANSEMTPGKWLLASAVAVVGVIAVGYLSGGIVAQEDENRVADHPRFNQNLAHQLGAIVSVETNESEISDNVPHGEDNENIDACMRDSVHFCLFVYLFIPFASL
jgi:hypothetical protein